MTGRLKHWPTLCDSRLRDTETLGNIHLPGLVRRNCRLKSANTVLMSASGSSSRHGVDDPAIGHLTETAFGYHPPQFRFQVRKTGDTIFHGVELALGDAACILTRCFRLFLESQKNAHRCQIETKFPGISDKAQSLRVCFAIGATAVGHPGWDWEDPDALVIANSLYVHARFLG